jgi:spore coat polysaccharide biosynthesis protein SpsF
MNMGNQQGTEVLIRCDGSAGLGLGHIMRCLALAMTLWENHTVIPTFALLDDGVGRNIVTQHGFSCLIKPAPLEEGAWIESLLQTRSFKTIILDIRTNLPASHLNRWRAAGIVVAIIDDPSNRRQAADLTFYPPVPQLAGADWREFTGKAYIGWDYILLRKEFRTAKPRPHNPTPLLLVTMGGSDPGGLTFLALEALRQVHEPFHAKVVLGRAFLHGEQLARMQSGLPGHIEFLYDVDYMSALMAECDLAIAAFGGTAYELAALNVPSILLGLTPDHARSAEALEKAGMAVSLGYYQKVKARDLAVAIAFFLNNPHMNACMSAACCALDGSGTERVAQIICERMTAHA